MMVLIYKVLCDSFLNLFPNLVHDALQAILRLNLKFLVMASALIRCSLLENFAKSIKNFCRSSCSLSQEIIYIIYHKLQIGLVLNCAPSSYFYLLFFFLVLALRDCDNYFGNFPNLISYHKNLSSFTFLKVLVWSKYRQEAKKSQISLVYRLPYFNIIGHYYCQP